MLVLASAACFGVMAIFAKLAYEQGATVGTLLAVRFLLAALALWGLALATGSARALDRRVIVAGLLLGGFGYAAQSTLFFSSLTRIDAALAALLLYAYPALVTLAAVALGREGLRARTLGALAVASAGVFLVLAGAGMGARSIDLVGAGLAFGSAIAYTAYILASQPVAGRVPPIAFAATVCTGASLSFLAGGWLLGELETPSAAALGWIACIALIGTVGAIVLFFAGLVRVGPSKASILSTVEPPFTALLALAVFGEALAPPQLAGGALVLAAVVALQWRPRPAVAPAPA